MSNLFEVIHSDFPNVHVGDEAIINAGFDYQTGDHQSGSGQNPDIKINILTANDGVSHKFFIEMGNTIMQNGTYYGGVKNTCHSIGIEIKQDVTDALLLAQNWVDTSGFYFGDPPPGPQAYGPVSPGTPAPPLAIGTPGFQMTFPPNTQINFHFKGWGWYPPWFVPLKLKLSCKVMQFTFNNIESIIEMN